MDRAYEPARRIIDVTAAGVVLLALLPLMALVAAAIGLETGRPVFFRHSRLGVRGRQFRLYKFRKFRKDCTGGTSVTVKNDERMTRLGRMLQQTKIDELPQLLNVLRGEMTLVGPRPEALAFADCFTGRYVRILDYKPGVFGPNQALFRDEADLFPPDRDVEQFYREILFPLKADVDLAYYPNRTAFSDMQWVIRGMLAVLGLRSSAAASVRKTEEHCGLRRG